MTKKQEQKKQVHLAEIEMRLVDLAQGAVGHFSFADGQDDGSAGLAFEMGISEWLRFVGAVKRTFQESGPSSEPAQTYAFELYNLHHFADRFDEAAQFLYDVGARA